jgi:hypothetical protein
MLWKTSSSDVFHQRVQKRIVHTNNDWVIAPGYPARCFGLLEK